jgi:hypothetical protein
MAAPSDVNLVQLLQTLQHIHTTSTQIRDKSISSRLPIDMAPLTPDETWHLVAQLHVANITTHRALLERFAQQLVDDGADVDAVSKNALNAFYDQTKDIMEQAEAIQSYFVGFATNDNTDIDLTETQEKKGPARPPQSPENSSLGKRKHGNFQAEFAFPPEVAAKKFKQAVGADTFGLDAQVQTQSLGGTVSTRASSVLSTTTHATSATTSHSTSAPAIDFEDITAERDRRLRQAEERRAAKAASAEIIPSADGGKRKRQSAESAADSGVEVEVDEKASSRPAGKKLKITETSLKQEIAAARKPGVTVTIKVGAKDKGKRPDDDDDDDDAGESAETEGAPKMKTVKQAGGRISPAAEGRHPKITVKFGSKKV